MKNVAMNALSLTELRTLDGGVYYPQPGDGIWAPTPGYPTAPTKPTTPVTDPIDRPPYTTAAFVK